MEYIPDSEGLALLHDQSGSELVYISLPNPFPYMPCGVVSGHSEYKRCRLIGMSRRQ